MQLRILLLTTILAVSPVTAFAGFELNDNGQAIDITNMPARQGRAVTYTPPQPVDKTSTLKKASRPENDPGAPSLQIFGERYLPDSIRKKYNIQDSWYDGGAAASPASLMPDASVRPMQEPLLVDDGPARPAGQTAAIVPSQPHGTARHSPASAPAPDSVSNRDVLKPKPLDPYDGGRPPAASRASEDMVEPEVEAQTAAAPSYSKVESWRARKGEPVREVLKRWSDRSGKELMWASGDAPNLPKDFSYVGSMENAVTALIKSTGVPLYSQYRSDGLTPVMMSQASTVTTELPVEAKPETKVAKALPSILKPEAPVLTVPEKRLETRWFALSGASLPEVIQVWADDEGAELLWQASRSYALKDAISQVGHFEDAVFNALSQFDNDEMRPVGQLYADPVTGRKVLLIRNDTPS